MMQAKKVACVGRPCFVQKSLEVSLPATCVNPLSQSACWQITVVVDRSSPARSDLKSSISIPRDSADQRPVLVLLQLQLVLSFFFPRNRGCRVLCSVKQV